jgi:hypothetical protein
MSVESAEHSTDPCGHLGHAVHRSTNRAKRGMLRRQVRLAGRMSAARELTPTAHGRALGVSSWTVPARLTDVERLQRFLVSSASASRVEDRTHANDRLHSTGIRVSAEWVPQTLRPNPPRHRDEGWRLRGLLVARGVPAAHHGVVPPQVWAKCHGLFDIVLHGCASTVNVLTHCCEGLSSDTMYLILDTLLRSIRTS